MLLNRQRTAAHWITQFRTTSCKYKTMTSPPKYGVLHPNMVRVLAYIARLLSSVASLTKILGVLFRVKSVWKWAIIPFFRFSKIFGEAGRQARNFKTNVPKILDLKSSEQIFSENWPWLPLTRWHARDSVSQTPRHYEITCAPSGNLKVNMF